MHELSTAAASLGLATAADFTQQQRAARDTAQEGNGCGVGVGSQSCKVTDGAGTTRRLGVDVGFTRESSVCWLVLAPAGIALGAVAGEPLPAGLCSRSARSLDLRTCKIRCG